MVFLIEELDNPFGYYEQTSITQNISLKPLQDFKARLLTIISESTDIETRASPRNENEAPH